MLWVLWGGHSRLMSCRLLLLLLFHDFWLGQNCNMMLFFNWFAYVVLSFDITLFCRLDNNSAVGDFLPCSQRWRKNVIDWIDIIGLSLFLSLVWMGATLLLGWNWNSPTHWTILFWRRLSHRVWVCFKWGRKSVMHRAFLFDLKHMAWYDPTMFQ